MSDAYLEKIAGELADLALADEKRSDDDKIVAEIGEIVGSSSQTLQEAYLTAVRVRRAEQRARSLLADRASSQITRTQRLLTEITDQDGKDTEAEKARQELVEASLERARASAERPRNQTTDGKAPISMPGRPTKN